MSRWWGGVAGWSVEACPILVATGLYGRVAGLSDDGTLLYEAEVNVLTVRGFPSLAFASSLNLDAAMDSLGESGGGNIQTSTTADDGYLYAAAYLNIGDANTSHLRLFKVLLDGSGASLLWTAGGATSTTDEQSIGWHPDDPDHIYLWYSVDAGGSVFSKIHRSTGAETVIDTFTGGYGANRPNMQQWDDGYVFFEGDAGLPVTGNIWAYDIGAAALDSTSAASTFAGMGTSPGGLTYWQETNTADDGYFVGHAFVIDPGPTIREVSLGCRVPWLPLDSPPTYFIANADRSQVYVGDGLYVWSWP